MYLTPVPVSETRCVSSTLTRDRAFCYFFNTHFSLEGLEVTEALLQQID